MNANATIGTNDTNDTNNMNTTGLNPVGNDVLQVIGGGGLSALEVVAASGNIFPPLKAAVIEVLAIIGIVKKFKTNKKAWFAFSESLIEKVKKIVEVTCQYDESQILLTFQHSFENLKGCVVLFCKLPGLKLCTSILDHLKEDVMKIQNQKGFPNFKKDQEHIASLQGKLNALPNFQACLRVDGSSQEADVMRDVWEGPIMTEPNEDDMSIERRNVGERPTTTVNVAQANMFTQAHDFQINDGVFNNTINMSDNREVQAKIADIREQSNAQKWLQELKAPSHGKVRDRCMPGTRKDVLTLINTWVNDLNEPNIFWLSGSPGSGKTTIASTVVADFDCLSGKFFFRRDEAELRDPDNLWRRIALDFSSGSSDFGKSITQALETQKADIRGLDISMQFEHLIVKPLQQVFGAAVEPFLVVVDALDECDSYEKLLPSLVSWSHLSKSLKLLITSRHYLKIQSRLRSVSVYHNLNTGHEVSAQTYDDLEKYFVARFSEANWLPPKWPGPDKISFLVRKAAGLFVWAKSAMDFILFDGGDPEERLNIISAHSGEGIDVVDILYHQIISVALQGLRKPEKTSLKLVLGSIIIAKNPLRIKDLTELLEVKDVLLNSMLGQLSPILSISDAGYLRICHQSVADFLLDFEHSQDLWLDPRFYSLCFAWSCLKLLNAKLRFNFFDLKTSYILNKNIPELNDHLESIKSTALDHASYFWASYLQEDCDKILQLKVQEALETFLMVHLLHWLEIMSLMGTVNHAAQLLLLTANWSKVSKPSLSDFAKDANRFVMEFLAPISDAAPHIYLLVKGNIGQRNVSSDLGHDAWVTSVAFSPDGRHIVSGSGDKTVRVWDAQTGQSVMDPLKGHDNWVTSVAFSPDGRHIVSGSRDKTVRVWDAQTGQSVMDPLKGHDDCVTSVAFSPDGRHIVSGSRDKTVRVWDAQTGQSVMDPLKGHDNWVTSVAFSPDGRHIVSGSRDKTVRVWDAQTGQSVMDPLKGHDSWVTSVAFSPDGRHIVSGSSDKTVRVWDAQTGQSVMDPLKGHDDWVTSVAFSPDGRHIVSGSRDKTVRVWDAQTGQSVMDPLKGHDDWVTSVAFSPDGRHIVSGSRDKTVRVWDAQTGQSVMDPLKGHDGYVTSVAFSPDGRHIVSGSCDKTVRVWDAQTGQSVMDPLKGHDNWVTSVAFSPDGRHIVSGSRDKTVRVWDAQTGQSVMDPLKGHDHYVTSVAFSPDGRHIVSGSDDETVRVWDAQTGQSVMDPLKGHDGRVTSVTFSPDGRHIVSGSCDKTVRVWDACDSYDIPLLKFCHRDQNWIMLPDNAHLLWLADQNKSGLFWPRTTAVIGSIPTSLQFKNFVHGVNWSQCFSSSRDPI
ncbi:uncharacterized protein LACBIDRAFT_299673 [Laccaria bicolor S238N-H82]|uniref:Predicted protein n=1 Tax=Laccaria bicolor (strain S238N-H82 / ATCC MYA-4686) TaxID=486041 RepID=B0DF52_LACBS|nr:uncharacterized protein LACBIDRAFT_299673 [Laccaria bicolor S238N-H82]EDR06794.1 predicted protein [Laccaria bicolor S238N-H82]|eukprot:XP_001882641.1 predicted protein [Laccaria bicolor S238N-H82]